MKNEIETVYYEPGPLTPVSQGLVDAMLKPKIAKLEEDIDWLKPSLENMRKKKQPSSMDLADLAALEAKIKGKQAEIANTSGCLPMTATTESQPQCLVDVYHAADDEIDRLKGRSLESINNQIAKLQDSLKKYVAAEAKSTSADRDAEELAKYEANVDLSGIICGLTPAEFRAIKNYTASGYGKLNRSLRGGGEEAARYEPYKQVLNSALAKLAKYKGLVNRGTSNIPATVLDTYQVGAIIDMPAFTSTSVGNGFGGTERYVIQSKTGAYIDPISSNRGELEVLIPAGVQFKVLSREYREGTNYFVMEEVGP